MKHPLVTMSLVGMLGAVPVVGWTPVAEAANSNVESAIQNYGDTSMFYQALINTGVINEMSENQDYTVFAPTNAAFAATLERNNYPCFYSVQCRPQIAALLRNHIIVGGYSLKELTPRGFGIAAAGGRNLNVVEEYVDNYEVEGQRILSQAELNGNHIYRIDGVIASPQDLSSFRTVTYVPAPGAPVTTEKTVIRKTYRTPVVPEVYPTGAVVVPTDNSSQTTTVTHTYSTAQ
ncbi:MAG: fasciclin domain-containing protein [Alphaproteobacteria bacterium]